MARMRRQRSSRRPFVGLSVIVAILALVPATAGLTATVKAQDAPVLVVDNEQTANPDLAAVELTAADGVEAPGPEVRLPEGFAIEVVASGLQAPRFMAFDSEGNLLVADQDAGNVYRYPAAKDTAIEPSGSPPEPLITGLYGPSSVAFFDDGDTTYLYVGETTEIIRFPYDPEGAVGEGEVVVPDLPDGSHRTRTIAFGEDGLMYVSIGSSCNICHEDDDRRAAIMRYHPDGSDGERFAYGLRNAVGLAFAPGTNTLWATVNERDDQGNGIPPDLVTTVAEGANYGWPDCQPPDATPQEEGNDCSGITPPTIGIQAHSAPLGLAFATGDQFPGAYQGGIFVVQHGSWNREPPAEPKLMYITFEDGTPTAVADFATGWQDDNGNRWGRPAGVVVAPDGSLIVSDDDAGVLYRISHE
jgi:glucose/arabinose dehydrogenase